MGAISKKLSKVALELHWKPKSIEKIENKKILKVRFEDFVLDFQKQMFINQK